MYCISEGEIVICILIRVVVYHLDETMSYISSGLKKSSIYL